MQTFSESDLVFLFPDDWVVRKFDETTAYQSLSGHGLKGVDFVALSPDGKLWLIEVKDYRPRFANKKEYRAKRRSPQKLGQHVYTKFVDTHRLLRIVERSLMEKWWFSIWQRFRKVFPRPESNYWFWTEASGRAQERTTVAYVLWMETPEEKEDYHQAVYREIAALLKGGAALYVVDDKQSGGLPFRIG